MNIKDVVSKFIRRNNSKRLRIAVLGDTLIDDYRYGDVNRISPEFPVQILLSSTNEGELCCGGAANVCHQMTHMNADVFLLGFVDKAARNLYSSYSFNTEHCVDLTCGSVPIKVRFYDHDFPLLRWDIEQPNYGEKHLSPYHDLAIRKFTSLVNTEDLDAVILSDYDKGFWTQHVATEILRTCKKLNIKTIVDPKKYNYWAGCDVLKPNAVEAKNLTGEEDVEKQLITLCKLTKTVIITQGENGVKGMSGHEQFEYKSPFKLYSREVNSCIGAGDNYIAMFTLGLSHGLTPQEAAGLAFESGVIYVKQRHNKPITLFEINKRIDPVNGKIVSPEELVYLKNFVFPDEKIVFSNGVFDFLHCGHVEMLQSTRQHGDKLVVGINTDESVRRLKGDTRPINTLNYRMSMVASQESVDYVTSFDEDTPLELINKIKPTVVVKGGDYKLQDVVSGGAEVVIIPFKEGWSTTEIIQNILDRHK